MNNFATKFTYDKPRFITSAKQDYLIQPENFRRYLYPIYGYYFFFILSLGFVLNFVLNKLAGILFDGSFYIVNAFMFLIGNKDNENKILYLILLLVFFGIIFYPCKKLVFIFTKPVNRVSIEEGLILIKGPNVFNDLEKAFKEMNNQK